MKLTKTKLKQLIKEEITHFLKEQSSQIDLQEKSFRDFLRGPDPVKAIKYETSKLWKQNVDLKKAIDSMATTVQFIANRLADAEDVERKKRIVKPKSAHRYVPPAVQRPQLPPTQGSG